MNERALCTVQDCTGSNVRVRVSAYPSDVSNEGSRPERCRHCSFGTQCSAVYCSAVHLTSTSVYRYIRRSVYERVHTYKLTCAYIHACACMCLHVRTCVHMCVYVRAYAGVGKFFIHNALKIEWKLKGFHSQPPHSHPIYTMHSVHCIRTRTGITRAYIQRRLALQCVNLHLNLGFGSIDRPDRIPTLALCEASQASTVDR